MLGDDLPFIMDKHWFWKSEFNNEENNEQTFWRGHVSGLGRCVGFYECLCLGQEVRIPGDEYTRFGSPMPTKSWYADHTTADADHLTPSAWDSRAEHLSPDAFMGP